MNSNVIRCPQKIIAQAIQKFETPFWLYEESRLRTNCRQIQNAFKPYFPNFTPLYALKANSNPAIARIIATEGFGIDCSSEFEAKLTKKLGVFGMYTGNYTTRQEFAYVLKQKNILLNLDDISMIPTVVSLGLPKFISFRINPGISGGGTKSLVLAGSETKFGVPRQQAITAYHLAKQAGVKKFGIHMMTGSNVLDEKYFIQVADKLLKIAGTIHKKLGIEFDCLNIGGGFGVPYRPEEPSLNLTKIARGLRAVFNRRCAEFNLKEPKLMIEPGRFITCDAGFFVTKVHVIKNSYKKFIGVDAGMNDLPRPAIYNAYHHITVLGRPLKNLETVNVVGRLCENNDQFAKNRRLPAITVGDILVIYNAGAHAYAMGHNYNNRPRSAEYLLTTNGAIKPIRRAETFNDLFNTTKI